jgi:hypothetical protein
LTTSRTFQTNLASTSTASFNGSANVTPGVTGTLPVANGGTNRTTMPEGYILHGDGTSVDTAIGLFWDRNNRRLGINTTSPVSTFQVNGSTRFSETNVLNALSNDLVHSNGSNSISQTYRIYGSSTVATLFDNSVAGNSFMWTTTNSSPVANFIIGNLDAGDLILGTSNAERMRVKNNGQIYVAGTTDRGAYNLQVNGTGVWGEGAYVNGSDANIKENIIDLDSSLNIVNNLKPVVFNYINASVNNDTKHLGFIAQDVYQTLENKDYLGSIVRSDGETLSIAYSNIIPLLTKAIQEQQALIKALEQRIINLENK